MPRLPDDFIHAVAYLYPDEASARTSAPTGATGVLIHVATPGTPSGVRYLLTNAHVADRARCVRLNRRDGSLGTIAIDPSDWIFGGPDDVALAPLPLEDACQWDIKGLDWDTWALNAADIAEWNVGPGDDVLMLGRLVGYEGQTRNEPVVRLGSIARMPGELVVDGRQVPVEAFVIEMRSLSGFSGSPTILVINPGSWRGEDLPLRAGQGMRAFLGLDTGHTQLDAPVYSGGEVVGELRVPTNSGMAIVTPAWRITELLHDEVISAQRLGLATDSRYLPDTCHR